MFYGSLFIGSDLLDAAVASSIQSGSFTGLVIRSERIYAATGLTAASVLNSSTERVIELITYSRAAGAREATEIRWAVVSSELMSKFFSEGFDPLSFKASLGLDTCDIDSMQTAVCLIDSEKHRSIAGLPFLFEDKIWVVPIDLITIAQAANALRRLPVKSTSELQSRNAVIVGLGSGGGEIALNLAGLGLGKLILIDHDRVHEENYFRSVFGHCDLGRFKVSAVKSCIFERELPTIVITKAINVLSGADEFRDLINDKPDLVICATDSVESRRFINYCCVRRKITCIIAGLLKGGEIGELMRIKPYEAPCYECIRLALGSSFEEVGSGEIAQPYLGIEEKTLGSSAFRSDVTAIASLTTRAALAELDPKSFLPLPEPYLVFGREAQSSLASPFVFGQPLSTNYVSIVRNPHCPVCGPEPLELTCRTNVSEEAIKIIEGIN